MRQTFVVGLAVSSIVVAAFVADRLADTGEVVLEAEAAAPPSPFRPEFAPPRFQNATYDYASARLENDLSAVQAYRPSYPFWQHVFTIPDGQVAFGSLEDGRLLATFPTRGDWTRDGRWEDARLASVLRGQSLPRRQDPRRDRVAELLERIVGGVVHNATRGTFVLPNVERYGGFLDDWAAIYERFGVPGEIGLAQAIIESGLNPRVRSEARAIGFCQWLESNWNRLKRYTPHVIEGYNQTTQAAYCAAYLTTLATKYGSFVPALSEHHAGGLNVGRTVINGQRLGGSDVRDRYFMGSAFALDLRNVSLRRYRDIFRTYGPRSGRYVEMVFGNTINITNLRKTIPQERIYAMRVPSAVSLQEISRRTGLPADEVQRFNPALRRQVPANANLYLPAYDESFGADVAFWHRPPDADYVAVLDEFLRMDAPLEAWDDRAFQTRLRGFQQRFQLTGSEEGTVMAAVLEYVIDENTRGRRNETLTEFQTSPRIESLFRQGLLDLQSRGVTIGPAFE